MAERLNQENFFTFLQQATTPVLVDFYKDGCIPCRRVSPLLAQVETAYAGKLVVARVNLTQSPELVEQYQVEAAPTLLLFRGEEEVARHRGVIDKATLNELIEQVQ